MRSVSLSSSPVSIAPLVSALEWQWGYQCGPVKEANGVVLAISWGVWQASRASAMRLSPVRNVLKVTVRVEDRDNLIPALLRRPLAWRLLGCVG